MPRNFAVALILSFAVLIGWETLVMGPRRQAEKRAAASPAAASLSASPGQAASPASTAPTAAPARRRLVEYTFGRNRVSFNTAGGAVHQWWIQEKEGQWVSLVPEEFPDRAPLATFPDLEYQIRESGAEHVSMEARRADGLRIVKTFRVSPESHIHSVTLVLENTGGQPLEAAYELGWGPGVESGDRDPKERAGSQRALAFEPPRLIKLKPGPYEGSFRWWGVDARYFLAAFLNESGEKVSLQAEKSGKFFSLRASFRAALAARQKAERTVRFYLGPKDYDGLASLNLGLERSVDFGFFGGLGRFILRCLHFFRRVTHNFGWAIVLLTMAIQILALPLTVKSFRHSQRMKDLQPQMKRLQELYKNDPKRLNVEMLSLYQRHGLRFMGMEGCFPILIQLPVFWALYTTLRNAYDLRHAPWIGWVHDLAIHDPFYVLPVLMGAAMLVQQKMTMTSMDPAQARIMYIMPVVFTFIFMKMPAGLVLYWLTNSLLTIAIQTALLKRQTRLKAVI